MKTEYEAALAIAQAEFTSLTSHMLTEQEKMTFIYAFACGAIFAYSTGASSMNQSSLDS